MAGGGIRLTEVREKIVTLSDSLRSLEYLFYKHRNSQKLMTKILKISRITGPGVDVNSSDKTVF